MSDESLGLHHWKMANQQDISNYHKHNNLHDQILHKDAQTPHNLIKLTFLDVFSFTWKLYSKGLKTITSPSCSHPPLTAHVIMHSDVVCHF